MKRIKCFFTLVFVIAIASCGNPSNYILQEFSATIDESYIVEEIYPFDCFTVMQIEDANEGEATPETIPETTPDVMPHYYAIALREFMRNTTGRTTAVLFDLDGCGYYEMIVFYEGIAENRECHTLYSDGGGIAIFDMKNPNTPPNIELRFLINNYNIYVSSNNYIVLSDYWEGFYYQVFRYENGVILPIARLNLDVMGCHAPFFTVDSNDIDEAQFEVYLYNFGIDDTSWRSLNVEYIAVAIGSSRNEIQWQDDTARILVYPSTTQ
jgi:hypothetical protein